MSARSSASATSSSLMKSPLPPTCASGRSRMRSPFVVMPDDLDRQAGVARLEEGGDMLGLPHRELAFAGGDAEALGSHGGGAAREGGAAKCYHAGPKKTGTECPLNWPLLESQL